MQGKFLVVELLGQKAYAKKKKKRHMHLNSNSFEQTILKETTILVLPTINKDVFLSSAHFCQFDI